MRTRIGAIGGLLAAAMLTGCSGNPAGMVMSGGKAAVRVIQGAEAKVHPLKDVSPAALADYREIRLGEVTTDVPALIPTGEIGVVRAEMGKELAGDGTRKHFPGGGKTLVANVSCRFLKERGTFGGDARLDMIVTLSDQQSQDELGRLFIEGVSKSPMAGKAEHMAKVNANELVDYLAKRQKGKEKD